MERRRRLASAEKVKELLDSAFASRYHDHATMLTLSSTAVVLAEEKSHELPPDLVVTAWTVYGNALRITGRYHESERALERASALPASDPQTKSNLLEVKAALYRHTGRFESAVQCLTAALATYEAAGDCQSQARTWNLLGITYFDWGDRQQALGAYHTALELVALDGSIEDLAMTGHNMLQTLIADGRLSAATSVLALLEPYYRGVTSARLSAKVEWMRARLCRELKQLPAAQLAYERAYALLSTEPRAAEQPELLQEMAELEAPMNSSPASSKKRKKGKATRKGR